MFECLTNHCKAKSRLINESPTSKACILMISELLCFLIVSTMFAAESAIMRGGPIGSLKGLSDALRASRVLMTAAGFSLRKELGVKLCKGQQGVSMIGLDVVFFLMSWIFESKLHLNHNVLTVVSQIKFNSISSTHFLCHSVFSNKLREHSPT